MRLSKTASREVKGKTYYKYRFIVTLGQRFISALGWEEGDELAATVRNGAVIVRRKRKA